MGYPVVKNVRNRIDAIEDVGTLPQVMARIMAVGEDDSSTALDLAAEIARDQSLTIQILRVVNSAYYGFHRQILTVPEAVVILGFSEVERLALAIAVIGTVGMKQESVEALKSLWQHSMACSLAGTVLEQELAKKNPEIRGAHVSGLLHDIGKAMIAQFIPEAIDPIKQLADENDIPFIEAERTILDGHTHCDIGSWMAERWGMPPSLVESIAFHHAPDKAISHRGIVDATHVSNYIVNSLGFLATDGLVASEPDEGAVLRIGYTDETVEKVRVTLEKNEHLLGAIGSGKMF